MTSTLYIQIKFHGKLKIVAHFPLGKIYLNEF